MRSNWIFFNYGKLEDSLDDAIHNWQSGRNQRVKRDETVAIRSVEFKRNICDTCIAAEGDSRTLKKIIFAFGTEAFGTPDFNWRYYVSTCVKYTYYH